MHPRHPQQSGPAQQRVPVPLAEAARHADRAVMPHHRMPARGGGQQAEPLIGQGMPMQVVDEPAACRIPLHPNEEVHHLRVRQVVREQGAEHNVLAARRLVEYVSGPILDAPPRRGRGLCRRCAGRVQVHAGQVQRHPGADAPAVDAAQHVPLAIAHVQHAQRPAGRQPARRPADEGDCRRPGQRDRVDDGKVGQHRRKLRGSRRLLVHPLPLLAAPAQVHRITPA